MTEKQLLVLPYEFLDLHLALNAILSQMAQVPTQLPSTLFHKFLFLSLDNHLELLQIKHATEETQT